MYTVSLPSFPLMAPQRRLRLFFSIACLRYSLGGWLRAGASCPSENASLIKHAGMTLGEFSVLVAGVYLALLVESVISHVLLDTLQITFGFLTTTTGIIGIFYSGRLYFHSVISGHSFNRFFSLLRIQLPFLGLFITHFSTCIFPPVFGTSPFVYHILVPPLFSDSINYFRLYANMPAALCTFKSLYTFYTL